MNEKQPFGANHQQTLCWDCAKAIGGCSWADYDDHTPVAGWTAIATKIRAHSPSSSQNETSSYIVLDCPEFERDAEQYGLRKAGEKRKTQHRGYIDTEAICSAYLCGVKIREIEKATGFSDTVIYQVLKEAGIKTTKKRKRANAGWASVATGGIKP